MNKLKNYGDIIGRLPEIIINGQTKKMQGTSEIISFRGYFIEQSDIQEFRELLAIESSFYSLNTRSDTTKLNDELLRLCEKELKDNPNNTLYIRLLEILDNTFGKPCKDLAEYCGYYIFKENYLEFCELCTKLKVGPHSILRDSNNEFSKKVITENINNKHMQNERLKNYIESNYNQKVYRSFLAENPNTGERNIIFEHVTFLGINNLLTINYVVNMRNIMSEEKFNQMLNIIKACKFFSEEEINQIHSLSNPAEKKTLNIDDLIEFFAKTKELDFDSLKDLIPLIGFYEYHYLIDELYKCGVITLDEWLDSTKELCNNAPDDNMEEYKKIVDETFNSNFGR